MSSNVRIVPISSLELFKQQLSAVTESIRFRSNVDKSATTELLPPTMGGIFTQREILSGGNVMRLVELPGAKNNGVR